MLTEQYAAYERQRVPYESLPAKMVFDTEWQNTVTTPIPPEVDPQAVIEVLHDHALLISLQPLTSRHEVAEKHPETGWIAYHVFETINLWLLKHEIKFKVSFNNTKDGLKSFVEASGGVVSEANYTVRSDEPSHGGVGDGKVLPWVMQEKIETSCSIFLKPVVASNMITARTKMHEKIMEEAKERSVRPSRKESEGF